MLYCMSDNYEISKVIAISWVEVSILGDVHDATRRVLEFLTLQRKTSSGVDILLL